MSAPKLVPVIVTTSLPLVLIETAPVKPEMAGAIYDVKTEETGEA
jgi:hypothetical protein